LDKLERKLASGIMLLILSPLYVLFVLGVKDTLFYLIAYQTIPKVYLNIYYLGIFFSPRREIVLFGNFIAFAFLFTAGMFKRRKGGLMLLHGANLLKNAT